ncbi:MAG: OmpA family protein [Planktotalea sp.]|uniref:OmpA family protein n=1 Tax=Planktotalea sp. TaxID=2029877 RepID=UPI003C71E242
MILRVFSFLLLGLLPAAASAVQLTLPASARQTAGQELGIDSYTLPIAPFDGASIPARTFEGFVSRQAWRIEGGGVTPLQLLQPLREELKESNYTLLFECADRACGGFDFRFGTDVLDAPDMYVDLDDYRFLSAISGSSDAPKAAISLLVSRSATATYVQIIQIAVDKAADISVSKGGELIASTKNGQAPNVQGSGVGISKQLDVAGHIILSDLDFKTGSSELGEGPFASLGKLAAYLKTNSARRVALVGHTDAEGSLEGNIALSKRRAASVRQRLIESHGVASAQLSAEGVGFLSPVASNLSKAGRDTNRRVEAVLISTE